MSTDQTEAVLHLKDRLEESVVGQSHALDEIARHIRTARAGLGDPGKPIGVFMLAGTSGVGKTETALALADTLYGGTQQLTTINMSEFKEEHKVSLLMGSPPGYVGYGEGGVLTEAVRRKPYSVVLLDELEKSHSGVQDVFYQVFDKGMMKDGQGRDIDFKNTVIVITTNAGTDLIAKMCEGGRKPSIAELKDALHEELLKTFKPAFLGRITVLPYFPLDTDVLGRISRLKLGKVVRRMQENHKAELVFTDNLIEALAKMCVSVDTGARKVDQVIEQHILPELSAELLARNVEGEPVSRVVIDWDVRGGFVYDFEGDETPTGDEVVKTSPLILGDSPGMMDTFVSSI
jgi:type VI secretion system protein VasG